MLLLALSLQPAMGTQFILRDADDAQSITTQFGTVSKRMARAVCASEFVYIGTVEQSNSFLRTDSDGATSIVSDLTFEVERSLFGDNEETAFLNVPGGTVGGNTVHASAVFPRPDVGKRYLIAYSTLKQSLEHRPTGSPSLNATFWVRADANLPAEQGLRNALNGICQGHGLPRYPELLEQRMGEVSP